MSSPDVAHNDGAAGSNATAQPQRKRPLTSTERSRNSRARKRAAASIARRRPPYGPEVIDPLGAAIVQELLDGNDCPEHLRQPRYRSALAAWGRAEAHVRLIASHVAAMPGVAAALTSVTRTEETAEMNGGRSTRRTISRIEAEAMAALDRAESRARGLRADLLLTPAAAARARLDVKPEGPNLMQQAAQLVLEDRRAAADREAGASE